MTNITSNTAVYFDADRCLKVARATTAHLAVMAKEYKLDLTEADTVTITESIAARKLIGQILILKCKDMPESDAEVITLDLPARRCIKMILVPNPNKEHAAKTVMYVNFGYRSLTEEEKVARFQKFCENRQIPDADQLLAAINPAEPIYFKIFALGRDFKTCRNYETEEGIYVLQEPSKTDSWVPNKPIAYVTSRNTIIMCIPNYNSNRAFYRYESKD